jgi:hypothetical protein
MRAGFTKGYVTTLCATDLSLSDFHLCGVQTTHILGVVFANLD